MFRTLYHSICSNIFPVVGPMLCAISQPSLLSSLLCSFLRGLTGTTNYEASLWFRERFVCILHVFMLRFPMERQRIKKTKTFARVRCSQVFCLFRLLVFNLCKIWGEIALGARYLFLRKWCHRVLRVGFETQRQILTWSKIVYFETQYRVVRFSWDSNPASNGILNMM